MWDSWLPRAQRGHAEPSHLLGVTGIKENPGSALELQDELNYCTVTVEVVVRSLLVGEGVLNALDKNLFIYFFLKKLSIVTQNNPKS